LSQQFRQPFRIDRLVFQRHRTQGKLQYLLALHQPHAFRIGVVCLCGFIFARPGVDGKNELSFSFSQTVSESASISGRMI